MSWLTGLWGWGEADAGEWQTLYRIEGARRALVQSRVRAADEAYFAELERVRAERRKSLATVQFAWSRSSVDEPQRRGGSSGMLWRAGGSWTWSGASPGKRRLAHGRVGGRDCGGRRAQRWVYAQRQLGRTLQ